MQQWCFRNRLLILCLLFVPWVNKYLLESPIQQEEIWARRYGPPRDVHENLMEHRMHLNNSLDAPWGPPGNWEPACIWSILCYLLLYPAISLGFLHYLRTSTSSAYPWPFFFSLTHYHSAVITTKYLPSIAIRSLSPWEKKRHLAEMLERRKRRWMVEKG